ncbi:hypothetical protein C8F04DRAFT_1338209 [Mycena alexandri]|uniref:Uncharacterized protein n=1 Tax=Mycena alexandri TaxID=1745969 RepID=A0AAD6X661_9AGAR|nr:hypothetical protein C8F04DRAFT_1338209 [Mycena alexandri]
MSQPSLFWAQNIITLISRTVVTGRDNIISADAKIDQLSPGLLGSKYYWEYLPNTEHSAQGATILLLVVGPFLASWLGKYFDTGRLSPSTGNSPDNQTFIIQLQPTTANYNNYNNYNQLHQKTGFADGASPDLDATVAHVLIQPIQDPTLCVTETGNSTTSPTILSPCNPTSGTLSLSQIWDVNSLGGNAVQFQSVGNNQCFAEFITIPPTNGVVVTTTGCFDVNGNPPTGTRFDASQAITQSKLPLVVTALNSQVGGSMKDTSFCLDRAGNSVVLNACSRGITQTWAINPL